MGSREITDKNGNRIKILFASTDRIERHEKLAEEFFDKILGIDYWNCIITDHSSLYELAQESDELKNKVLDIYKVDISDIESGNFADIFERIDLCNNNEYIM